jgi:hypothetical protein
LPAFATFEVFSDVTAYAGNDPSDFFAVLDYSGRNTNANVASLDWSADFDGFNNDNEEDNMAFYGSGRAQAGFGLLRTEASGTVENVFYNPVDNLPLIEVDGTINPDGVPQRLAGEALAGWVENVQYGGTAIGYSASYVFNLSGFNGGDDSFSFISAGIAGNRESRFLDGRGFVQETFVTNSYDIAGGIQEIEVRMSSQFQTTTDAWIPGTNVSGSSDFFSTLELTGIIVYDENGDVATDVTAVGESGTVYNVVPEPSLMIAGGLGLLALARRRKR